MHITHFHDESKVFVPVSLSEDAHFALELMREEIRLSSEHQAKFPNVDRKNEVRSELISGGYIKKYGFGRGTYYRIPTKHLDSTEIIQIETIEPIKKTVKMPVSRGRHLPTAHVFIEFGKALEEESRRVNQEAMHAIQIEMERLIKALPHEHETTKRSKTIQELSRLNDQLQALSASVMIQAVRNLTAIEPFKAFDWSEHISMNQDDYRSVAVN